MEHVRINSISTKRFFLLGIVMLSGYLGFAQNVRIEIVSLNEEYIYNYYELEYREVDEDDENDWISIEDIEAWTTENVAGIRVYVNTSYYISDLVFEKEYEVRVRAYLEDEFGCRYYGSWGTIKRFTMPTYDEWYEELQGDIVVYVNCGFFSLRNTGLNLLSFEFDDIIINKERDMIKEED